ncbi:hypothetical protein EDB87DRAFT_323362 [Lactarius vividus]|nr:hypothetical protein EDB87DRAFT_323362 [Lactarius vividus]
MSCGKKSTVAKAPFAIVFIGVACLAPCVVFPAYDQSGTYRPLFSITKNIAYMHPQHVADMTRYCINQSPCEPVRRDSLRNEELLAPVHPDSLFGTYTRPRLLKESSTVIPLYNIGTLRISLVLVNNLLQQGTVGRQITCFWYLNNHHSQYYHGNWLATSTSAYHSITSRPQDSIKPRMLLSCQFASIFLLTNSPVI